LLDGVDDDGDGYASEASVGDDCDDERDDVHPCADDLPGDSTDANCDGYDAASCDDCAECTVDTLVGLQCVHEIVENGSGCDDGNPCTNGETCWSDVCGGGGLTDCDDEEPCTDDFCLPSEGCVNDPVTNGTQCGALECWDGVCGGDITFGEASVVSEMALAPAPDADAGEAGCCCDFDDDGVYDNAISLLGANMAAMSSDIISLSLVNEELARLIEGGLLLLLLEYEGLGSLSFDSDVVLNTYSGADANADLTDNFGGDGEFLALPRSLSDAGDPLFGTDTASTVSYTLSAGPFEMELPLFRFSPAFFAVLAGVETEWTGLFPVEGVRLEAQITADGSGYALTDGRLCGYVTMENYFINPSNAFVAEHCDCLNITGALMVPDGDGRYSCNPSMAAPTCDPDDPDTGEQQKICNAFTQYCSTWMTLMPMFVDVDLEGDISIGEALSFGMTFSAAGAGISGVLDESYEPAVR